MKPGVYPKPRSVPDLSRRWLVECTDLIGEAGYRFSMERSFRTYPMARMWAWYMWQLGSYGGGSITIRDQRKED